MAKKKTCSFCKKEVDKLWYASPKACMSFECRRKAQEQRSSKSDTVAPKKKQKPLNQRKYKPTGEKELFLKIYAERNATCQITGEFLQFDVWCFAHILSKGSHNKFRLNPDNIIMVKREIHDLYDNRGKEKLLEKYPKAEIIYKMKQELKSKYNGTS